MSQSYDFYIKKGNTGPDLQVQFQDEDGDPIDITGYSALTFSMRNKKGGAAAVDGEDATEVVAADGTVKYEWEAADTAAAGEFEGEFSVTIGGQIINYPNNGFISILISESI